MPKYLIEGNYLPQGAQGLIKAGGSSRRAVIEGLAKGMGGSVEAVYFAFGDGDIYAIVDVPDHATIMALSLAVNSTGAVKKVSCKLSKPINSLANSLGILTIEISL